MVLVPLLALAWWLFSPLLFDKTVEEEFPLAASADVPKTMTRGEVEAVMKGMAEAVVSVPFMIMSSQQEGIPFNDFFFRHAAGPIHHAMIDGWSVGIFFPKNCPKRQQRNC